MESTNHTECSHESRLAPSRQSAIGEFYQETDCGVRGISACGGSIEARLMGIRIVRPEGMNQVIKNGLNYFPF
jgi:hypothetical protein